MTLRGKGYHLDAMARSLKTYYLSLALAGILLLTALVGGLLRHEHETETAAAQALASTALEQRLEAALEERARAVGEVSAAALAVTLPAGNLTAATALGRRLLDQQDIERVEIADRNGLVVFADTNLQARHGLHGPYALSVPVQSAAGPGAVQHAGELRLWLSRASLDEALAQLRAGLQAQDVAEGAHLRRLLGALSLGLLAVGMGGAWFIANRLARPIAALVRTADRIGEGDYTRPLAVARSDEIGELQSSLERLRQNLRDTTITRNYLNTVLNSLGDAVLVTSPAGLIKSCNDAAQLLLGFDAGQLLGTPLMDLIDEAHRASFEPAQPMSEVRETVLRTARGQTIPVSMASSPISTEDPEFQGYIYVARNITERKRAERRIRYLARYDNLTKMPNRMQFQHLLQQAIARCRRNHRSLVLLYMDLDRFKEVNDTFGHSAGDRTLEVLSERLTRALNKDTVVGRLAGDEFAMFVDDLPSDVDSRVSIGAMARNLLDEISRTFYVGTQEVYLTASVGIALYPTDADNVVDIIRNADAAMYHSKQNGGNSYAFYLPEMNAIAVERLMLKAKLRRALERNEFVILYQSKVDLRDGRIIGAEALLRWRLPGHGDISPAHFIPLAEETSLIMDIGEWVMDRVCADYRAWQASVPEPGRISINLSLRQLKQPSFIARAGAIFRRHGVDPGCFELEVTETTLMTDPKRTIGLLNELFEMGLHLSIDDFGTGYSSLSALQQFPIETLKIDQSFVRDVATDPDDAAIVRTIIEMGKSLELEVIAEGVESREQLEFLRQSRCYYAQGLLFGACVEAHAWLEMLRAQSGGAGRPHFAALCGSDVQPLAGSA
jgi:diguanylate cyclase (GGDEF)-like protein/PAS domain S-box-containing protein